MLIFFEVAWLKKNEQKNTGKPRFPRNDGRDSRMGGFFSGGYLSKQINVINKYNQNSIRGRWSADISGSVSTGDFPAYISTSVFLLLFRKSKKTIQKNPAPFGGDLSEFGPVLNQNTFEISHFCVPQAKFLNILRLKNGFSFIFRRIFWKIRKFSIFRLEQHFSRNPKKHCSLPHAFLNFILQLVFGWFLIVTDQRFFCVILRMWGFIPSFFLSFIHFFSVDFSFLFLHFLNIFSIFFDFFFWIFSFFLLF